MAARRFPIALAAAFLGAGPSPALTIPIETGGTIELELVAQIPNTGGPPSTLSGSPTSLTHAGDGSGRLFVAGLRGAVDIIDADGVSPVPFLDVRTAGVPVLFTFGEVGLLGMAFHPDYATAPGTPGRGKFYTYTSEVSAGVPDFSHPELDAIGGGDHHSVIREWTVSATDPGQIDLNVGSREIMRINQPQENHNGGDLAFDALGNLYISLGVGGGANDQGRTGGPDDPTDGHTNGIGNAQDTSNVYGSILRIDPLGTNSANGRYGIPTDNPFVGVAGVDEIYAYGLRNPFRISFDLATGDLYAGDVGQMMREEVDQIFSGGNYGWVHLEGTLENRVGGVAGTIPPIGEYGRDDGISVIGGFVYRGSTVDWLVGRYVFGDLLGRLFYLDLDTGVIRELLASPAGEPIPGQLYGFGQDEAGELYALFQFGEVMRLVPEPSTALLVWLGMLALAVRTLHARAARRGLGDG